MTGHSRALQIVTNVKRSHLHDLLVAKFPIFAAREFQHLYRHMWYSWFMNLCVVKRRETLNLSIGGTKVVNIHIWYSFGKREENWSNFNQINGWVWYSTFKLGLCPNSGFWISSCPVSEAAHIWKMDVETCFLLVGFGESVVLFYGWMTHCESHRACSDMHGTACT